VTYTVLWDGDATSRWSSATVTVTVRHRSTLTLDGPSLGVVGKAIRLDGVLTVGGQPPPPGATLTVHRTVTADGTSHTTTLPAVAVNADGSYTVTDTPATGGRYLYLVLWAGDSMSGPAKAVHTVRVKGRSN
jgi:hypothetical protein